MEVKGLSREGWYQDVNFKLKRGEVLGIAGMLGSGRTELVRGIFGADPVDRGEVIVDGKTYKSANPIKMVQAGVGLTPEDRKITRFDPDPFHPGQSLLCQHEYHRRWLVGK